MHLAKTHLEAYVQSRLVLVYPPINEPPSPHGIDGYSSLPAVCAVSSGTQADFPQLSPHPNLPDAFVAPQIARKPVPGSNIQGSMDNADVDRSASSASGGLARDDDGCRDSYAQVSTLQSHLEAKLTMPDGRRKSRLYDAKTLTLGRKLWRYKCGSRKLKEIGCGNAYKTERGLNRHRKYGRCPYENLVSSKNSHWPSSLTRSGPTYLGHCRAVSATRIMSYRISMHM